MLTGVIEEGDRGFVERVVFLFEPTEEAGHLGVAEFKVSLKDSCGGHMLGIFGGMTLSDEIRDEKL